MPADPKTILSGLALAQIMNSETDLLGNDRCTSIRKGPPRSRRQVSSAECGNGVGHIGCQHHARAPRYRLSPSNIVPRSNPKRASLKLMLVLSTPIP